MKTVAELNELSQKGLNVTLTPSRELLEDVVSNAVLKAMATLEKRADEPKFLSVEKTQEMTDVSRTTLWHWERKGILKPVKIGRTVKYRYSDVINLIEGKGGRK